MWAITALVCVSALAKLPTNTQVFPFAFGFLSLVFKTSSGRILKHTLSIGLDLCPNPVFDSFPTLYQGSLFSSSPGLGAAFFHGNISVMQPCFPYHLAEMPFNCIPPSVTALWGIGLLSPLGASSLHSQQTPGLEPGAHHMLGLAPTVTTVDLQLKSANTRLFLEQKTRGTRVEITTL